MAGPGPGRTRDVAAAPPTESQAKRSGTLVKVLAVALPLVVLAVSLTVVLLVLRQRGEADAADGGDAAATGVAPLPPDPVDPGPGAAPAASDPDAALAAMQQRYRPGPFVRVVGLLPSAQGGASPITWLRPSSRTIDNPWLVRSGELRPTRAPDASAGSARPGLGFGPGEDPTQPLPILAGVPAAMRIRVTVPEGRRALGFHVAFGSYLGHFFLPASGVGQDGEVGTVYVGEDDLGAIELGISAAVSPSGQPIPPGQPLPVTLYIAVEDDAGTVSDYVTRQLQVLPVGAGDLEVALTMTQATDLDLYVVEPTGVAIYYRNTSSFTGGRLDLDANAACSSNVGVNAEHVFWPAGATPSGVFTVRVANYTSCIGGGPVDYQVTVRSCGETAVFAGSFTGMGDRAVCTTPPGLNQAWCHDVVTFQVPPCVR